MLNARRHDLIPLEDLDHSPATAIVAPDSTEGMHEFSRRGEESFDGFLLQRRRGLGQQLDDGWDIGHCIVSEQWIFRCCGGDLPGFSMVAEIFSLG